MIYYSLRSGDVAAALQAAEQAGQGLAEVCMFVSLLVSSTLVTHQVANKLKFQIQFRHSFWLTSK